MGRFRRYRRPWRSRKPFWFSARRRRLLKYYYRAPRMRRAWRSYRTQYDPPLARAKAGVIWPEAFAGAEGSVRAYHNNVPIWQGEVGPADDVSYSIGRRRYNESSIEISDHRATKH